MGRRRKEQQASQDVVEVVDADSVDAAVEFLKEVEAEAPAGCMGDIEETACEELAPIANPTKWVVLEDAVVSLFGQMTTLPAGTLVSAASYGPIGIKRIMEQGVALEPVA